MLATCRVCEGAGRRRVRWNGRPVVVKCHGCAGRGKVDARRQYGKLTGPAGGRQR
jgi:DnaJ-class molecular chaperone